MELENLTLLGGLTITTGIDFSVVVNWDISDQVNVFPECGEGGWYVENAGKTVGFNIQNSKNCGFCNASTQYGNAIATFTTGNFGYNFEYELVGAGEREATGYENMSLYLTGGDDYNNTLMVFATSPGGGLKCTTGGAVLQTVNVPPPIFLKPNREYIFRLQFTTADPLYHIDCFYQCNFTFTR